MPTVSLLSIELSQGTDTKGASASADANSTSDDQQFSKLVDQHMSEDNSGNRGDKAAGNGAKATAANANEQNKDAQHSAQLKNKPQDEANKTSNEADPLDSEKASSAEKKSATDNVASTVKESDETTAAQQANKTESADLEESEQLLNLLNSAGKLLTGEKSSTASTEESDVAEQNKSTDGKSTVRSDATTSEKNSATGNQLGSQEGHKNVVSGTVEDAGILSQSLAKEAKSAAQNKADEQVSHASNKSAAEKLAAAQVAGNSQKTASEQQSVTAQDVKANQPSLEGTSEADEQLLDKHLNKLIAGSNKETDNTLTSNDAKKAAAADNSRASQSAQGANAQNITAQAINEEVALNDNTEINAELSTELEKALKTLSAASTNKEQGNTHSAESNKLTVNAKNGTSTSEAAIKLAEQQVNAKDETAPLETELTPLAKAFRDSLSASDNTKNSENPLQSAANSVKSSTGVNAEQFAEQEHGEQQNQQSLKQQEQNLNLGNADKELVSGFKVAPAITPLTSAATSASPDALAERGVGVSSEQLLAELSNRVMGDNSQVQKAQTNFAQETIAIHHKDFNHAVKEKVMLMVSQKLQQVDIRLDPPELGSMQIRVNLQNEQAAVSFTVQNQQAKEAIEQNLSKLRDMLEQSGVDVGDANINHQQSDNQNEEFSQQGGRFNEQANEAADVQMASIDSNLFKPSANGIDYYA